MKPLLLLLIFVSNIACALTQASGNGIVIADTSGSSQTNSPQTVTRFFKEGEIPHFAQAVIAAVGVLTQCDVKNRWADGSVKFAIISFVVPKIDSNGTLVTFQDQDSGHNTGYLTQSEMLGGSYNFDATMSLSGKTNPNISARTILAASLFTYWL
jgi:hypothetical protein